MGLIDAIKSFFMRTKSEQPTARKEGTIDDLCRWLNIDRVKGGAALSEATYFACMKVLSESIGKLPLKIQQTTDRSGVRVVRESPYYRMINERPNRFMTATSFWTLMELCRNHYGNSYALIDTRDIMRPQLWPMDPRSVRVVYDNAMVIRDVPDIYYEWSTPKGLAYFGSEEVLHFKSQFTLDGLVGVSVREQLVSTIQSNVKAQNLLEEMYESGMTAKSVLQYTGSLNDDNVKTLVSRIQKYGRGKINGQSGSIIPIPIGFTLTPLNIKLADAQFLEAKQYTALQIASAFGVKPYQVGDYTKSSYANAEAQQLSFLIDTLLYIVKSYEEEIGYKLLTDEQAAAGYHVKFNTGAILRADMKTQIETLQAAVNSFIYTPNEAREYLDKPALPGGDRLIGNGSAIPIEQVGTQYSRNEG